MLQALQVLSFKITPLPLGTPSEQGIVLSATGRRIPGEGMGRDQAVAVSARSSQPAEDVRGPGPPPTLPSLGPCVSVSPCSNGK